MQVVPAILTADQLIAQEQIDLIRRIDQLNVIHLDIIDEWPVDNFTLTPADFAKLNFGRLLMDFHLMTNEPLDYVYEIIDYQSHLPTRSIIGQIERMSNQLEFVNFINKRGWLSGLALDLHTDWQSLDLDALSLANICLVMGVQAGFQAQVWQESSLRLLDQLIRLRREKGLKFEVVVDGGVNLDNIEKIAELGTDQVCVGSAFWQAQDKSDFLKQITS